MARRFSRHASTYDRYAVVQRDMARSVAIAAQTQVADPTEILEIGCGTGRLTVLLRERFPASRITAVDIAEGMLSVASSRLNGAASGIRFVLADIETLPLEQGSFDLVVSSATIQWLCTPEETMRALAASLRPGASMLHATFGPCTFAELHATFAEVERDHGLVPRPHGVTLRPAADWARLAERSGLAGAGCETARRRVDYRDCRSLLQAIKRAGASDAPPAPAEYVRLLPEVLRRYDERFRSNGGVYATYEILHLTATARARRYPRRP